MSNALQIVKDFCRYVFVDRDCDSLMTLFTQDVCWIGNDESESGDCIADARKYFASEISAMPGQYQIRFCDEKQREISDMCSMAMLRLELTYGGTCTRIAVHAVTKPENGIGKICSVQMAVIDAYRHEGEDYITTKTKAKINEAKTKLALSTMSGGLMGGYITPGFPFYFVNERMLEYLGYASEAEFVSDIDGMIQNCIHPDDRDMVDTEVNQQLANSDEYTVEYRMRKKDGSYIWVHDIGKKTIAEDGEPVIISVCYDISEDYKKQIQLDNLVDALPGGTVLYRMEKDGGMRVLYQSKGVSRMTGHSPEEFEELVTQDIRNSVYRDDIDKVNAAINKAATSDENVAIDFRILHANGNAIWISASYKRTAIENGCPIIHSVFTEMPQMRKLMNDVVENSGVAVIVSDNKTRELLYVNRAALKSIGKLGQSYEGKLCHKFLLDCDEPCAFCKNLDKETSIEKTTENYLPQLDRYFITQGCLVNWAGRDAHIEYMMDITAAKKAQQQQGEMLDNITCGVVVSKRKDTQTKVLYLNRGLCDLLEQDAPALRKKFDDEKLDDVYDEDLPILEQLKKDLRLGKEHTEATFRYHCSSNRMKWIHVDINAVVGMDSSYTTYASYYDVTKQIEQENQLRDVVSNVPGGVCMYRWDGHKIQPVVVSEQFSTLLGADASVRLNETDGLFYKNVHPDDRKDLEQAIRVSVTLHSPLKVIYRALNGATGEYIWLLCNAIHVLQEDGTYLIYASYADVTVQKLTEQKLLASERAIDFATEEASLWYWQYDPNKKCAYFGKRCMRDFGLPAVMNNFPQAWLDTGRVLPEYKAIYLESVKKIDRGEPQVRFEAQLLDNYGVVHWAEIRLSNLPGEHSLVVCTAHVIDYEKSLAAKYEIERQKPSLGESDLLYHAIFDLNTGATQEYGSDIDKKVSIENYPTLHKTIDNVVQNTISEKEKQDLIRINRVDTLMNQLQKGITSFATDYRRRIPDGTIRWVKNILRLVQNPANKNILLFEYCYDITNQKMLEEVLRLSAGQDYECVSCVDFRLGTFTSYSGREYGKYTGYHTYKDLIQAYANNRIPADDREAFLYSTSPETVLENISADGSYSFTIRVLQPDGTTKVERIRYLPYDVDNQLYVLIRMDVTDVFKTEELQNQRLREAMDIAQQANAAKTNFLASMSHDMRTPMNAIIGMCDLAISDEDNQDLVHKSLSTIQSSSELLLGLINNILDMNRIENGTMVLNNQDFSIAEEVKKTEESYRLLAEQKKQILEIFTNVVHDGCHGDVARIHSALDNILTNAIKYTPEGGKITYRVTELPLLKENIGHYRFEISDTGVGMNEETQKHLFESLYRGDEVIASKIEGTGLGLAISKAIIDLKGGTISFKSKKGQGTTFIVELPIPLSANSSEIVSEKPIEDFHQYDLRNVHILLCEDHPINQKVACAILEKAGAKVTTAVDGRIGLDIFLNSPIDAFDLILMDIRMPNMDGYEATQKIRESMHPRAKTIPIVAMTANAFSQDVQKSLDAGMNAHLAKPITPMQLYKVVEHYTKNDPSWHEQKLKS